MQAPYADSTEVDFISRFKRKVVWSQRSPFYLKSYYAGYENIGIPVNFLPYAWDVLTNSTIRRLLDTISSKILFSEIWIIGGEEMNP